MCLPECALHDAVLLKAVSWSVCGILGLYHPVLFSFWLEAVCFSSWGTLCGMVWYFLDCHEMLPCPSVIWHWDLIIILYWWVIDENCIGTLYWLPFSSYGLPFFNCTCVVPCLNQKGICHNDVPQLLECFIKDQELGFLAISLELSELSHMDIWL